MVRQNAPWQPLLLLSFPVQIGTRNSCAPQQNLTMMLSRSCVCMPSYNAPTCRCVVIAALKACCKFSHSLKIGTLHFRLRAGVPSRHCAPHSLRRTEHNSNAGLCAERNLLRSWASSFLIVKCILRCSMTQYLAHVVLLPSCSSGVWLAAACPGRRHLSTRLHAQRTDDDVSSECLTPD